ncbi:MAG TPA: phosphoenolpyruvate--protein phosphotransferase [Actinomycetaceae bacterium]|nr:phosphoenolpyruvate--protein phosphotransferase [Actinomycetaceae bacterium]
MSIESTHVSTGTVTLKGTGVVPGIAYAPAGWARPRPALPVDDRIIPERSRDAEKERFLEATTTVAGRLAARAETASGAAAEVLAATANLASDRGWLRAAQKLITAGTPATMATIGAIDQFVTKFEKLGGLMAERITDLKDIRDRVLAELMGQAEPGVPSPDSPIVLLAEDLAPADTALLDPSLVTALVTELGGPTSHTAIIARQLGIPCVVGVADLERVEEGTAIVVDGAAGTVVTGVPANDAQRLVAGDADRRAAIAAWRGPAALASGEPVQLLANVQNGSDAHKAATGSDAEGVGLFRTELAFLKAQVEPAVDEQAAIYRGVLEAYAGKKVVIRTLDAGSDKPVPFASQEHEENPSLGVRGIRLSFSKDGLLDRQLDGIVRAKEQTGQGSNVWVMAPMIATIDEARRFAAAARERGLVAGIMVEVPSVAVLAEEFLDEVDFLSIGTNDLTQYTMAADRLAPELAYLTDPWQPAVLRLVATTAAAGVAAGKPVGVCGEAAADPILACVLTGMGITSLSMAAAAIPAVGMQLGRVTSDECREAAEAALGARTADAARARVSEILNG